MRALSIHFFNFEMGEGRGVAFVEENQEKPGFSEREQQEEKSIGTVQLRNEAGEIILMPKPSSTSTSFSEPLS